MSFKRWLASPSITLVFIALCAVFFPASAQIGLKNTGAVVTTPQVRAELLAYAPDGVGAGKQVWVGLQITHQPEWHTYWKNSGDSGQPTDMQWTLPAGVQPGETRWPVPKKIWIGSLANYGYENTVLLPVPLEISSMYKADLLKSDLEVKLKAVWLVCKQECIPEEGEFALKIPATSSTALHKAAFDAAFAAHPQDIKTNASAKINGKQLEFSIRDLPAALQGKSLQLFPETPEVLDNGAKLANDGEKAAKAKATWQQAWAGDVWTASFPISAQRSASPELMPLVLTADGKTAVRVQAKVDGEWPKVAAAAQVSPELAAALKANAGASQKPVQAGGSEVTSLLPALLLALLGGLILNLMPCVLPVLAIKVLGFANAPSQKARVSGGAAYTVGVVLSFLALGGLMLALRAGGEALGWGFQLQSPVVIAALAVLFTLIALNLLGVFELANVLPSSVATLQAKNPQVDAFLSGVLAVAIASPCTAPFMGASLGFALGLPAWQALAVFAALGIGMALPYLAASLVPAVANLLPRPGAWMDVFKKFMAFPMLATVVWLLWVIGQQTGIDGAAALLVLLLCVAMLAWALSLRGRSRIVVAIISIAVCAVLMPAIGQNIFKIQESTPIQAAGWQAWEPGKVEQLLASNQAVFVDFTAAWCVTCQYNKKTTLSDPAVLQDIQAKKVQLLRADWTKRDPAITQAITQLGRSGVPVYVIYKPGSAPVILSEILDVQQVRAELAKL
ncbi:MAG: protein-disulfide reductase [Burkholderiales bacterium]|nr:MAG: protein-disulfide reductase [Burkholderiales bacterium]